MTTSTQIGSLFILSRVQYSTAALALHVLFQGFVTLQATEMKRTRWTWFFLLLLFFFAF